MRQEKKHNKTSKKTKKDAYIVKKIEIGLARRRKIW